MRISDKKKPTPRYHEPEDTVVGGDPELDVFRYELWARRIRATPERLEVMRALSNSHEPISAKRLCEILKKGSASTTEASCSRATIYRTVKRLATVGVISKCDEDGKYHV